MKILNSKLKNTDILRTQKNYPIPGIEFIDIVPYLLDKDIFDEIISKMAKELSKYEIDYIVAPEARGFFFGPTLAKEIGVGCIPVRKKGKMPNKYIEKSFLYEKEYGKDVLEIPKLINDDYNGKNIYIFDDIYATGNTIKGIEEVITELGGNVVGIGVIINILNIKNNKNIYSLIEVEEE